MISTQDWVQHYFAAMKNDSGIMLTRERDGVPALIQHVRYSFPLKAFIVRLFDGNCLAVDDGVVQGLGLFDWPQPEHFMDFEMWFDRNYRYLTNGK